MPYQSESVQCDECGIFEMSKSYSGHRDGTDEYDKVSLPDECPVCDEEL